MALPSLPQAQKIVYDAKYLWDVFFVDPAPPAPFNDTWFPAIGTQYDLFNITNYPVETTMGTFLFPQKADVGNRTFSVTFHDDITNSLLDWLDSWFAFTFPRGYTQDLENSITTNTYTFVRRLSDVCGKVEVSKLGLNRQAIKTKTFFIILDGTLVYLGENDNGLSTYTQSFKIVGSY